VYVCGPECEYVQEFIHTYIHTYAYMTCTTQIAIAGTVTPLKKHTYIHIHTHTHIQSLQWRGLYIHGTGAYTHIYIHTYIHAHIHTYIHTYIGWWSRLDGEDCISMESLCSLEYTYTQTYIRTHTYIHRLVEPPRWRGLYIHGIVVLT
jgi:hypothetical protein